MYLVSSKNVVWNIFHSKKNWTRYDKKIYVGRNAKYPFSSQILMKLAFSWQFFQKYSKNEFHINASVGAEFSVRWEGRTGMTTLIFAFRYFMKAPEIKISVQFLSSAYISISNRGTKCNSLTQKKTVVLDCYT